MTHEVHEHLAAALSAAADRDQLRLEWFNNAHAIAEQKLPRCKGSWFSLEFRHLRYINWTIVLPVVQDMLRRMMMDSVWQLLKHGSLTSRLHDPAFTDSLHHFYRLESFRPEAVLREFFATVRPKTSGVTPLHLPTV